MLQKPKVLILYYSLSGQTRGVLGRLIAGLEENGVSVTVERLVPERQLRFPFGSVRATLVMMFVTLLRKKMAIEPIAEHCFQQYDCIILAGPTWSYNPSGPVLGLLDQYGKRLFDGSTVLPLISCRGYWRMHWFGLRRLLRKLGATVPNVLIFTHPCKEPWRTIGVFLKLAGKTPERLLGAYYPRYGHSREQLEQAYRYGQILGKALLQKKSLKEIALPPC